MEGCSVHRTAAAASQVRSEPSDYPLDAVDAPVGAADAGEVVGLVRVPHHLDRPAALAQHRKHELALDGRAPEILFRLQQQQRA